MGLRKILTDAEPALHKVCKPVTNFDSKLFKLLDDMHDTLIESGGVIIRIPASQINVYKRDVQGVIVMRVEEGNTLVSMERIESVEDEAE